MPSRERAMGLQPSGDRVLASAPTWRRLARRTAWPSVAAAIAGFVVEATVAAVPGSPLQPVLAPGADPGGPFVWAAETVGSIGSATPSRWPPCSAWWRGWWGSSYSC